MDDENAPPTSKVLQVLTRGRKVRVLRACAVVCSTAVQSALHPQYTISNTLLLLRRLQKDLWNGYLHRWVAWFFDPLREFVLDPLFAVGTIVLPPLATAVPGLDQGLSLFLSGSIVCLRLVYRSPPVVDLRQTARQDFLVNNKAGLQWPTFQPPSNAASAFRGVVAFATSVAADIVSVLMDCQKMAKWFETLTEFKAYLDASGVASELEESIVKPLWRGRLLDNIKILNDIQENMYADRCRKINSFTPADVKGPILEGKRMMRFATSAYGTEMIRSALDREAHPHELENQLEAIAFHSNVAPADIRILAVNDGGDMNLLRHFVAIDHVTKSVVLALRGTLSVSGALVDMTAMDCDFCGCKAHKGMAAMANNVWLHSGPKILALLEETDVIKDYSFTIVGHSLGAGVACLLQIKCYKERLLGDRLVKCYGFAPPPTVCTDTLARDSDDAAAIQRAIDNTLCYIHDNDCVPLLSVMSIRRLAVLMDTVDNRTEHMWAFRRFKLFWEWEAIPPELVEDVQAAEANKAGVKCCDGASKLVIPAKMIVWMKKNFAGSYEAFECDPTVVADMNIFCCQDMVTDHLVEAYEDVFDELADKL